MNGGPSQVDTWDYKPELDKRDGQELEGFDPNTGFFNGQVGPLMKSPFKWAKHGQCGKWVCELFPHMAKHVDKMAFIHSLWTDSNNHSPALFKMNTGMTPHGLPVRRLVGHLRPGQREPEPAGVRASCTTRSAAACPKGHALNWGAGFLPSIYQGTALKPQGEPIDNLTRPDRPHRRAAARAARPARASSTRQAAGEAPRTKPDLAARVETFELAYRMQMAAPEALDLDKETDEDAEALRPRQPEVRRTSPSSASSPGGWSSAASASCRSTPAAWRTT